MTNFSTAASQSDASRLPVVQGITFRLADSDDLQIRNRVQRGIEDVFRNTRTDSWQLEARSGRWVDAIPLADEHPPAFGLAWNAVHAIRRIDGVELAEPLLLVRLLTEDAGAAQARFGIWGFRYGRETQEKIDRLSKARDWSLRTMRVPEAWDLWKDRHGGNASQRPGHGVRIAHPDTGYTRHVQIAPILDGGGRNFVEKDRPDDALDDLRDRGLLEMSGHGTGTASVIASLAGDVGSEEDVLGVAPGALIRPLRVSSSVIHFSFRNVVGAIEDAIENDCHVISMSLGGPNSSESLRDVVQRALDEGIIVVAAAGNYVPTVVFPAALEGVVACAASNAADIPWRFSGFGDEVVITAPGEKVWRANAGLDDQENPTFGQSQGTGTSHATAGVAGMAALWISFHGRDQLIAKYGKPLLPFAFYQLLQQTADETPGWVRGGDGGFGAGIANAKDLLGADLPERDAVQDLKDQVLGRRGGSLIDITLREIVKLFRVPTRSSRGFQRLAVNTPDELGTPDAESVQRFISELLGDPPYDPALLEELMALISTHPVFHNAALGSVQRIDATLKAAPASDGAPVRVEDRLVPTGLVVDLLGRLLDQSISDSLRARLNASYERRRHCWSGGNTYESTQARFVPEPPANRQLRVFAFDPSLTTELETSVVNTVTVSVPFEADLREGPVGDYLEVVDVDPATSCVYPPVDLNDPALMAQDGLRHSVGNPQFHQQMVYAVAMKTIRHFEGALGRPILWSALRPWSGRDDHALGGGRVDRGDRFVQRLRLYPHALREANAYYSPAKRAILFGYFRAKPENPGQEYPGGVIFTCLSHDIIAHEVTHAILDGMHVYFTEPTNPDVFAFHEAFADIIALFLHFTYPEVLRDQIARTCGDLTSENLLGQLARQFGIATGRHHALRDAIGSVPVPVKGPNDARNMVEMSAQRQEPGATPAGRAGEGAPGPPVEPEWMRYQPNPFLLPAVEEPHARGAILVAAVFDAFLKIYESRIEDLTRIATGGTGILPPGQLHPDLVSRMAGEASKAAEHILRICIRAMDYVPPVDITFGEYLRALVTADHDLVPNDDRLYRVAFIDAFRSWGIYPRNVRTLSEESLRWHESEGLYLFPPSAEKRESEFVAGLKALLREATFEWQREGGRAEIYRNLSEAQRRLHGYFRHALTMEPGPEWLQKLLPGIDTYASFSVANLRPARRIGPNGEFRSEVVFEVIQPAGDTALDGRPGVPFRGGVTVIVALDDWRVRYTVYKRRIDADGRTNADREARQRLFADRLEASMDMAILGAAEYQCDNTDTVTGNPNVHREAMRASSCACRERRRGLQGPALSSPFALLHRGRM